VRHDRDRRGPGRFSRAQCDGRTALRRAYHFAHIYTGLGEDETAIDCLERAFEERSGGIYGVKGSYLFAALRNHPRFQALLRRMNL